jgi:GR25 family glycosyltransferase involved in LPS biosynthesis
MNSSSPFKLKAYCINLDRRPENYVKIQSEFADILALERYPGIDGSANGMGGQRALYETNKCLFNKIYNSDDIHLPCVAIIEDDVAKTEYFEEYFNRLLPFLQSDAKWDFIALEYFLHFDRSTIEPYTDSLYKVSKHRNAGFMIYNTKFIRKMVEQFKEWDGNWHILDMTMTHDPRFIKLVPSQFLVRQIPHISDVVNAFNDWTVSYDITHKYMKEYLMAHYKLRV